MKFINMENACSLAMAKIPTLLFSEFQTEIKSLMQKGASVVHFFGFLSGEQVKLLVVLKTTKLWVGQCVAPEEYDSLSIEYPGFQYFERELAEQYGIIPLNHPWFKGLRYHANRMQKKDAFGNNYSQNIPGNYPFYEVAGEEVHSVGVGPIHAGVIEPGHFRFNCIGEQVLNLEILHGYQHRGVEEQIIRSPFKRIPFILENSAGDSSIAESLAFSEAIENLCSLQIREQDIFLRGIALELERLANHVGDLGALSGDIGFLPPAAYFGRIRGEFLNLLLNISGNRFGKGLVRPGGITASFSLKQRDFFLDKIKILTKEIKSICDMMFTNSEVLSRFEETGVVSQDTAVELGLVGVAARASGIAVDIRSDFPTGVWVGKNLQPILETSGDVMARAMVRYRELVNSLSFIEEWLSQQQHDISFSEIPPLQELPEGELIITLQEAWRGELSHCLLTGPQGKVLHYKIKDPSFHNWPGLEMAVKNEGISDFPVCNKSFNLSYCGFDL